MKFRAVILSVVLSLLLAACGGVQEMAYVKDACRDSAQAILTGYSTVIHPGDQLYIYVHSQVPEAAVMFNQEAKYFAMEASRAVGVDGIGRTTVVPATNRQHGSKQVAGYLVEQGGTITFPILGTLPAAGLSREQFAQTIERKLVADGYLYDPVVTVSVMNFRVAVVGEVAVPQELHVTGDRITLLEALARCGDITDDGRRENVTVVRDINGVATPITVDLTQKRLFESPAYYLQSGDVVYVEPSGKKKRSATLDENWPKYAAFFVGLSVAINNLANLFARLLRTM